VAFYLGIDGGGSKTTCAVADETSILATATTGPSNIVRVGEARARESLHQCVRQACSAAGINPAQIVRVCVGAAGAARPEIVSAIRRLLAEFLSSPIEVFGDMEIALVAAFGGGPGVIVIAGTGSIAYGHNGQGMTARSGGHGAVTSDEGSAHWIGKRAFAWALEKEGEDALLVSFQKAWDVHSPEELKRIAASEPMPNFARLFPAVLTAANAGNQLAQNVLAQAGQELAKLAIEVISQLFAPSDSSSKAGQSKSTKVKSTCVPLGMVGGVFRHARLVREVFYNRIHEVDSRVAVKPGVVDPVEGALHIARNAAKK
jgi:glucosamine kinase